MKYKIALSITLIFTLFVTAGPVRYSLEVTNDEPVLWHSFDNYDANINGFASRIPYGGNVAYAINGTATSEDSVLDTSYVLSGSNYGLAAGAPDPAAFSVEVWAKSTNESGWSGAFLSYRGGAAGYILYLHDINMIDVHVGTGALYVGTVTVEQPELWHQYVLTFDNAYGNDPNTASTAKFYVDGLLELTQTGNLARSTSVGNVNIGNEVSCALPEYCSNYFTGLIDEYSVYASALTEDRILAHYVAATQPDPTVNEGDLNVDGEVDPADLVLLAAKWLKCTTPNVEGCECAVYQEPIMYMKQTQNEVVVDGDLSSDWADAEWIDIDKPLYGVVDDVVSAKLSVKWDGINDKVYAAVVVDDSSHIFVADPQLWDWNTNDGIEIYTQGDITSATKNWGSGQSEYFDTAQQYLTAPDTGNTLLQKWGNSDPIEPEAGFEGAVSVNGSVITYEFGVKIFDLYGVRSGETTVVSALEIGRQIRFDLIDASKSDTPSFGWLAINTMAGKFGDAVNMQLWELVDTAAPVGVCGDWGYLTGDINLDCNVNIEDYAVMADNWLK